jgi:hypothetical protein
MTSSLVHSVVIDTLQSKLDVNEEEDAIEFICEVNIYLGDNIGGVEGSMVLRS